MRVEAVLLVVVCVVGLSMGADSVADQENAIDSGSSVAPKACCVPSQWEAEVGAVVGLQARRFSSPTLVKEALHMWYDSKGQRVSINGTVNTRRGSTTFRVIQLYKQKKMYVVDQRGKCVSQDLPVAFKPYCIEKGAKYEGRFRMGLGKELLQVDSWLMSQAGYTASVTVTPKSCVPVSEAVFGEGEGRRKVPMLGIVGFVDVVAGIKTPTVFNPPKDCPAGESQLGDGLMMFMNSKFGDHQ